MHEYCMKKTLLKQYIPDDSNYETIGRLFYVSVIKIFKLIFNSFLKQKIAFITKN